MMAKPVTGRFFPRNMKVAENKILATVIYVAAALSALFMVMLVYLLGSGLDFTDESYYLLFISNPQDYSFTVTQFGYLYGAVFDILGRDIFLLRTFNAFILAGASVFLFRLSLPDSENSWPAANAEPPSLAQDASLTGTCYNPETSYDNRIAKPQETFIQTVHSCERGFLPDHRTPILSGRSSLALSCAAAASSATFYGIWVPTPGYNSLNLTGLITTACGMLLHLRYTEANFQLVESSRRRISTAGVGWILIGVGGWMCFMAKPPTALGLAVLILAWSFPARGYSPWRILIAVATALVLLVLSALWIDGSPATFVQRYISAMANMGNIEAGSGYGIIPHVQLKTVLELAGPRALMATSLLFASGVVLGLFSHIRNPLPYTCLLLTSGMIFIGILASGAVDRGLSLVQGWAPCLLLSGAWSCRAAICRAYPSLSAVASSHDPVKRQKTKACAASAACILLFPFIYGFGSNNPFPLSASLASSFFVAAFLVIESARYAPGRIRILVGASIMCQMMALAGLAASWRVPYRQPTPLWTMKDEAPIRVGESTLRLPPDQARLIGTIHRLAEITDLRPGTPIIDMSGRYPGAIYAASGRTFINPFLVAGYDWSNSAAQAILGRYPCNVIGEAWILVTEKPIFSPLDPTILSGIGIEPNSSYEAAFRIDGYFTDAEGIPEDLYFLQPKDPNANISGCLASTSHIDTDATLSPPS
jgi:hypothetical protein